MKDWLLALIAVAVVLIALRSESTTEIADNFSPSADAFVKVQTDKSSDVTTIETQVQGDYIEHQTIISGVVPSNITTSLVDYAVGTTANGKPGQSCNTIPGDIVMEQGGSGECKVLNGVQLFFVAPTGVRSYIKQYGSGNAQTASPSPTTLPTTDVNGDPLLTANQLYKGFKTEALIEGYKMTGGELPLGFRFWNDYAKRTWLLEELAK